MAFHVRCNFDRIQSYAQAAEAWEKAVIFPKDREGPRGLVSIRKKHMTIERTAGEDIILWLYDHPVVTWRKDNSFTVCGYSSRSTTVFGSRCLPLGVFVSMRGGYFSVTVHGRAYKVADKITFRQRDNTWKADEITPWSVSVVNRSRAKEALRETNYKEFRLWLQVYMQMASPAHEFHGWANGAKIVSMIRDRGKWRELVTRHFRNKPVDRALSEIRQAIYHEYGCIDSKSVSFLE